MSQHDDPAAPSDPIVGPAINASPVDDQGGGVTTKSVGSLRAQAFTRYGATIVPDTTLQAALDGAIARRAPNWPTPVAVVALNPEGAQLVAQFRGTEVHYIGSLIKVAAMYAAFELRRAVRDVADELGSDTTQGLLLKQAADHLDPQIRKKVGEISALNGIADAHALPRYKDIFDVAPFPDYGFGVDFTAGYASHLNKMITISVNASAAACIHGVGFGYLNGALASADFFDPSANNGVWLGGDFTGPYPVFRIPSVNDGPSAQAGTVLALARMFTLIRQKSLVDESSCDEMLALLAGAVAVGENWINRVDGLDFTATHTKIGLGPLKNGGSVWSETSILKHSSGREFVAAWENYDFNDAANNGFDRIGQVLRDAIDSYLGI